MLWTDVLPLRAESRPSTDRAQFCTRKHCSAPSHPSDGRGAETLSPSAGTSARSARGAPRSLSRTGGGSLPPSARARWSRRITRRLDCGPHGCRRSQPHRYPGLVPCTMIHRFCDGVIRKSQGARERERINLPYQEPWGRRLPRPQRQSAIARYMRGIASPAISSRRPRPPSPFLPVMMKIPVQARTSRPAA
jgi:hypothetical protein